MRNGNLRGLRKGEEVKLNNKLLLVIDGMNLFHRAYYKYNHLSNSEGIITGAMYGFLSILMAYQRKYLTSKIIIAWESKSNWRKKKKKDYKKGREKRYTADEKMKFDLLLADLKRAVDEIGILSLSKYGYEADDVIGYIVKRLKKNIIIVSNDKDLLQLINDKNNVKVLRPNVKEGSLFDKTQVKKCFNVYPRQIPLYLSIVGDKSDNIEGIKGYGEKKSASFINNNILSTKMIKLHFSEKGLRKIKRNMEMIRLDGDVDITIRDFKGKGKFQFDKISAMIDSYQIKRFSIVELKLLNNKNMKKNIVEGVLKNE